jgi:hypothetical protein
MVPADVLALDVEIVMFRPTYQQPGPVKANFSERFTIARQEEKWAIPHLAIRGTCFHIGDVLPGAFWHRRVLHIFESDRAMLCIFDCQHGQSIQNARPPARRSV